MGSDDFNNFGLAESEVCLEDPCSNQQLWGVLGVVSGCHYQVIVKIISMGQVENFSQLTVKFKLFRVHISTITLDAVPVLSGSTYLLYH